MALAVTHVIGTIFILDLFRHYVFGKEKFPRYLLLIGGIAGLAPDLDIPLSWFLSLVSGGEVALHGVFTHSLLFVVLFSLLGLFFHVRNIEKWRNILFVIAAGWFMHIVLDCLFNPYSSFLWPFGIDTIIFCPEWVGGMYRSSIDAIILVTWLVHEELHNRIKDYL
tara:strand:+ start:18274 stop:18771 length:498 start_codon:yes stop_codon:yes gene_type:complete